MTAEQLEEISKGRNPAFMGMDHAEVIASLARRAIAAEKLVEEVERVSRMISQRWQTTAGDKCFLALDDAATAYREASK